MTRRWMMLLSLLGISGWLALFGDKTPTPLFSSDTSAAAQSAPSVPSTFETAQAPEPQKQPATTANGTIMPLIPRKSLMAGAGPQRNLFNSVSWAPPAHPAPPPTPVVATTPPLPFTYLGKKHEIGQWEVFLGAGDQTFIVQEGSTVNEQYHINSIKPPTLTLTYLPLNQVQTLSIGGNDK